MLLNFSINNFEVFNKAVKLDMEANLHTKKFLSNVVMRKKGNALKSIAIYGPNNTGKTCVIEALTAYKDVLLNKRFYYDSNIFNDTNVVSLGAEFLCEDNRYSYCFSFDTRTKEFIDEEFALVDIDEYGNKSKTIYFYRNTSSKETISEDEKLNEIIKLSSKDNILIYAFDTIEFPLLDEAKRVLNKLANKMVIISMHRLNQMKTIEVLKNPNSTQAKKVVNLIKAADLDIEDYKYSENMVFSFKPEDEKDKRLKELMNSETFTDQLRLISIHKGKPVPSIKFDSMGTKKIIGLSSYIVDTLENNKILIIDELDIGLQFRLSRSIISLFNNILNNGAQLICTTHDVSLLDIKTLFRKDQIWFTDKDLEQAYLYSLSNFTADAYGIRSDTDILDKYSKGIFGALPDPSLVEALLSINEEV